MNDIPSEDHDLEPESEPVPLEDPVEEPAEEPVEQAAEPEAEPVDELPPAPAEEPARALVPGEVRVDVPPSYESRWREEWDALHPALRAAITCWPAILVFAVVSFGSLGILAPFCYPVQLIVYGCAGALAVRWAQEEGRADTAFAMGLLAGITLAGLDILTYFAVNVLVGLATGGLGLVGFCIMAACAPLDAALSTLVGGVGAVIYDALNARR